MERNIPWDTYFQCKKDEKVYWFPKIVGKMIMEEEHGVACYGVAFKIELAYHIPSKVKSNELIIMVETVIKKFAKENLVNEDLEKGFGEPMYTDISTACQWNYCFSQFKRDLSVRIKTKMTVDAPVSFYDLQFRRGDDSSVNLSLFDISTSTRSSTRSIQLLPESPVSHGDGVEVPWEQNENCSVLREHIDDQIILLSAAEQGLAVPTSQVSRRSRLSRWIREIKISAIRFVLSRIDSLRRLVNSPLDKIEFKMNKSLISKNLQLCERPNKSTMPMQMA